MFLMLFCSVTFLKIQLVSDNLTNRPTDRRVDGLTDQHTLLKRCENALKVQFESDISFHPLMKHPNVQVILGVPPILRS